MEYTGLQQYTGRAKGVTPSGGSNAERSEAAEAAEAAERSSANSPPLPAREGAPLEAPPEAPQKNAFSLIFSWQSGRKIVPVLAGGGCGDLHRKNSRKSQEK